MDVTSLLLVIMSVLFFVASQFVVKYRGQCRDLLFEQLKTQKENERLKNNNEKLKEMSEKIDRLNIAVDYWKSLYFAKKVKHKKYRSIDDETETC